ncbi:MAG: hypothetical protein WCS65_01325 [Verrucomicrobiae bacterium]
MAPDDFLTRTDEARITSQEYLCWLHREFAEAKPLGLVPQDAQAGGAGDAPKPDLTRPPA